MSIARPRQHTLSGIALQSVQIDGSRISSGSRHSRRSANPDDSRRNEDGFSSGLIEMLNQQFLDGKVKALVIVAAPRTLGEMKAYNKSLADVLIGEVDMDVTGHSLHEIEKALSAA